MEHGGGTLKDCSLLADLPCHPDSRTRVQNPQSILINSKGYFADCAIGAAGSTVEPTCAVTQYSVPPGRSAVQPWASAVNPGGRWVYADGPRWNYSKLDLSSLQSFPAASMLQSLKRCASALWAVWVHRQLPLHLQAAPTPPST
jgi:hypothetical protein